MTAMVRSRPFGGLARTVARPRRDVNARPSQNHRRPSSCARAGGGRGGRVRRREPRRGEAAQRRLPSRAACGAAAGWRSRSGCRASPPPGRAAARAHRERPVRERRRRPPAPLRPHPGQLRAGADRDDRHDSTGTRFFVRIAGSAFVAPPSSFAQLQSAYAQAAARSPGTGSTPLTSLGIDPGAGSPRHGRRSGATLDGVQTQHISAGVNARASWPTSTGSPAPAASSRSPVPAGRRRACRPLSSRRWRARSTTRAIDVYIGAADHVLRRSGCERASILRRRPGPRWVACVTGCSPSTSHSARSISR